MFLTPSNDHQQINQTLRLIQNEYKSLIANLSNTQPSIALTQGAFSVTGDSSSGSSSGGVSSVALSMPAQFAVVGSPITSSGTFIVSWNTETANTVFAGPTTGAADVPAFRALVNADLPTSGVTAATYGDATHVSIFTVNAQGVLTSASTSATALTPQSRLINTGTGLSGGGDLTADRTLSIANTAVAAGSYGDATHVGTFTVNAQGQLTAASSVAISFPGGMTGFGTPSANAVGIAAPTSGVATTAIRSDATFQIDQSIAPTWTGVHTFTNGTASSSTATGTIILTGTSGIGCGGAIFAGDQVSSNFSTTATSGTVNALRGNVGANPGSASAAQCVAALLTAVTANGNAQNFTAVGMGGLCGASMQLTHQGTGTLTRGVGINSTMNTGSAAGPITDYMALRSIVNNTSASTIASAYGYRIESFTNSGGGAITTLYGLKVENQTVGGTNYAIFTGTGIVHIGDTTASTTTTNGCATFGGGVGVAGTLNAANLHGALATTDLTGTLQAAQMPALTGDVSNSAGSLTVSLSSQGIAKIRAISTMRAL